MRIEIIVCKATTDRGNRASNQYMLKGDHNIISKNDSIILKNIVQKK